MRYFKVANLEHYQHYKDRRPAWVKLHRSVLESYDFGHLSDASKWLALGSILLASECDNRIPWDAEWVGKRLQCTEKPNLDALLSAGFITLYQPASGSLAESEQPAIPETEKERETEGEKKLPCAADAAPPKPDYAAEFATIRSLYPKREGSQGWPIAEKRYVAWRKKGVEFAAVLAGVRAYAALMDAKEENGTGTSYVCQAQTFFGPQRRWEDEYVAASADNGVDAELQAIAEQAAPNAYRNAEAVRAFMERQATQSPFGVRSGLETPLHLSEGASQGVES